MIDFLHTNWPIFFFTYVLIAAYWWNKALSARQAAERKFENTESSAHAREIIAATRRMWWALLWFVPATVALIFLLPKLPGIFREEFEERRAWRQRVKSAAKR